METKNNTTTTTKPFTQVFGGRLLNQKKITPDKPQG